MKALVVIMISVFIEMSGLAYAQSNDLTLVLEDVFHRNSRTDYAFQDSIDEYSVVHYQSLTFSANYTRYFKNNYFIRLKYGLGSLKSDKPLTINDNGLTRTLSSKYQYYKHNVSVTAGKTIDLKALQFSYGGELSYTHNTPFTQSFVYDWYAVDSFVKEQSTVYSYPSINKVSAYLEADVFFKVYKPFYIGLVIENGLSYVTTKGKTLLNATTLDGNRNITEHYEGFEKGNTKQFQTDLLQTSIGFRLRF